MRGVLVRKLLDAVESPPGYKPPLELQTSESDLNREPRSHKTCEHNKLEGGMEREREEYWEERMTMNEEGEMSKAEIP